MKKITVIKKQFGQSIIEMVFAVGVVALVVAGVIVLVVNAVGVKSTTFQRKKAMEMAEIVMEDLVDQKRYDIDNFWNFYSKNGETLPGFDGYQYGVGYSGMGCGANSCVMAIVTVKWGENETLEVSKFFSENVY